MLLDQNKAIKLLKKYHIQIPKTLILKESYINEIKLNFPLALKIDSPQIIHKSDLGLVYTNIKTLDELNRHLKTMMTVIKMHHVKDYAFVVQEMVNGIEVIMGMKRDETFGSVILFGLGGVFVELFKDVSMRIPPLTKNDCINMIEDLRAKKIFDGFRNYKSINKEKIIELLLKLSKLSLNEKNINEIDFNPVIINQRAIVVDARIIMK